MQHGLASAGTHVGALQVAFDGIGSMPMARIENYRQVKQEAVEFEMKRRNARKNLDHALIASPEDSKVMQVEGETCRAFTACAHGLCGNFMLASSLLLMPEGLE